MEIYRQGDVLLIRQRATKARAAQLAESLPVPREAGRVVLAHGEATGHAHALTEPTAALVAHPTTGQRHLRVLQRAKLFHEEHAPIELPPGLYEVRRQREYHPDELRTVAD